ncbi:unnamed protein product [Notodromas monacha]|uniref:Uncharacterized protein n=1 Tax=Notodromas monacha TaxID=399045 RepID=A0A7R9BUZ5_9CRUS|nr:unnamed protein product [Notodromas monacha]CAG0920878.1 unnamed protein product [Notodromas monacha]
MNISLGLCCGVKVFGNFRESVPKFETLVRVKRENSKKLHDEVSLAGIRAYLDFYQEKYRELLQFKNLADWTYHTNITLENSVQREWQHVYPIVSEFGEAVGYNITESLINAPTVFLGGSLDESSGIMSNRFAFAIHLNFSLNIRSNVKCTAAYPVEA